jgi:hypothetical protein
MVMQRLDVIASKSNKASFIEKKTTFHAIFMYKGWLLCANARGNDELPVDIQSSKVSLKPLV